ncbi:hypothetical protein QVD17_20734 [Tagetes erecta]|uniref:Uncharacterized protein n=1 Tax=Tagetes erecta TaxID=13708 RepID=A0AAD8KS78_TARER|nr:hypothetical protein QVD17_20734 [Tagetes erecta]
MMDKKGLNINRPLLSVRRFSSVSSSSKNENRRNDSYLSVRPAVECSKTGSISKPLMNSGSVPFGWEHTPGRPKNENASTVSKVPPGRFFKPRKIIKPECSKFVKKESSGPRYDEYGDSSGEVYMDALDTLSRGETSFRSCNASGVNGFGSNVKPSALHSCSARGVNGFGSNMKTSALSSFSASGLNGFGSNVKPSAFLLADPRNFMLGRFLPAARAIAKDVPRHSFKENNVKTKPQEVKKLVHKDSNDNKVHHRYEPNFVKDVTHDKEEEQDDYDSDYEYQVRGKKSSRFCGLIPRFCSANSVHGMSMRTILPNAPANKTLASSSSTSSFRETASEPAKSAAVLHGSTSCVLKSESIELANLEGSKLYNRLQGPWISVDVSGSIQSTVSEQSDSSLKKKGLCFKEMLADKNTDENTATCSQDSILEKTLYVDTVRVVESPKEDPIPSFTKPQSSFNKPLESDMFADDPKHDMKARKFKDFDADLELFDDVVKGKQKLKAYETKLFQHPAPPPLPKSPSDSWLCRALPSVSSKRVPMMWIPKYPSAYIVTNDPKANDNINLQSPQAGQFLEMIW